MKDILKAVCGFAALGALLLIGALIAGAFAGLFIRGCNYAITFPK